MRVGFAGRAALATLLVVALLAPSTGATLPAEPTRDEYVDAAEPICRTNVNANKRIFKGAKGEVKRGKLKKASVHFLKAANAFNRTITQLAALPQPPTDAAKLGTWLGLLRTERDFVRKIGKALAAEKKPKAESLSVALNRNSSKANNAVLSFGFDFCRLEPSRFG
jgi:hypothetical protein